MPNLDQQTTKVLYLTVLQRMDPYIEHILITAAHVTFYAFDIHLNQWVLLIAFEIFILVPALFLSFCFCFVAQLI